MAIIYLINYSTSKLFNQIWTRGKPQKFLEILRRWLLFVPFVFSQIFQTAAIEHGYFFAVDAD